MHVHNIFELWKNKRKKGPDLFCSCNEIKKIFKKVLGGKKGTVKKATIMPSPLGEGGPEGLG